MHLPTSVCLLTRLLKNACMDLDEMLRVDRCRDMDELINCPLMFDDNFGKCEPIFKILSPADS